jgi:uncharacterized cupin superfamily protein
VGRRTGTAGFRWKRLRLARRLGAELLGASVYGMPPGERSFPYHLHHGNEELLVVLEGSVAVRTAQGEQRLGTGEAMLFRRGPEGAHQVINRSEAPSRFIIVSTMIEPDITEFPDTGKFGLFAGAAPGGTRPGDLKEFLRDDFAFVASSGSSSMPT